MSGLLKNAVDSLVIGVEDFAANDERRTLSAVRNFYAGTLLLAKEVIVRKAPNADPDEVIGAKYKPVPDGSGGVKHVQEGYGTVDFNTIATRFKDFGIKANPSQLKKLNNIRNDIEHRFTTENDAAIREAIATAFPLVSAFFHEIDESPFEHLGESWQVMLETAQLYQEVLKRCQETLSGVKWHSNTLATVPFSCLECGSGLVAQEDANEADQDSIKLICKACGEEQDTERSIEAALRDALEYDSYTRAKEGLGDGPLFTCPNCGHDTYIEFEDQCAACGYEADGDAECARCGNEVELDVRLYGDGGSLCSYCAYVSDKVMRE